MQKSDMRIVVLLSLIAVACVCVMVFADAMRSGEESGAENGADSTQTLKSGLAGGNMTDASGLQPFDPNTVDSTTLLKYGLGPVQIHSLLGYRRHNGTFDKPLAVSRLYNWSDADVEKVLPYIKIGKEYQKTYAYREQYEKERQAEYEQARKSYEHRDYDSRQEKGGSGEKADAYERKYAVSDKFASLTKVDLNTADTTLLKRIPGVGSGIANAIVKQRGKLGGFYKVEQLADLKFVSPELYEWFKVEPSAELHLINITKASFQTLSAHPYISYNQTRDLMSYRRLYGVIKDAEALVGTHIFTKEEVERLAPYLEY